MNLLKNNRGVNSMFKVVRSSCNAHNQLFIMKQTHYTYSIKDSLIKNSHTTRPKVSKDRSTPLTYEQAKFAEQIGFNKSWNSWNTCKWTSLLGIRKSIEFLLGGRILVDFKNRKVTNSCSNTEIMRIIFMCLLIFNIFLFFGERKMCGCYFFQKFFKFQKKEACCCQELGSLWEKKWDLISI